MLNDSRNEDEKRALRRRNITLALVLTALALGFYAGMFFIMGSR